VSSTLLIQMVCQPNKPLLINDLVCFYKARRRYKIMSELAARNVMSRSSHDPRAGQAIALVSVGIVFIFGILGLVVDVGWGYYRKQVAQAAVDSAVIAAASAAGTGQLTCGSGGVVCAPSGVSCSSATGNLQVGCQFGVANGVANSAMTIAADLSSNTPLPGITSTYWVKATVAENLPLTFLNVMGFHAATVGASATAGVIQTGAGGGCVYTLNHTATRAFSQSGNADLESACGVLVNSSDSQAIWQTGGTIINTSSADTYQVPTGGYRQTGSSIISPLPAKMSGPVDDPLAGRTLPTMPTPVVCSTNTGPNYTPGTYCGGIAITSSAGATLAAGTYFMDGGGFNINGSGIVSGSGITVVLTYDSTHPYAGININGGGAEVFAAPTSGPNEALLFVGDRTIASSGGSVITGSNTLTVNGLIYLPKESLTYTGGSSMSKYTTIISDTLRMTGLTYINSNYGTLSDGNPIPGAKAISLLQ
jgi:hypothetical protein